MPNNFFVVEIRKPFHQEVGIGKGFNSIEIIKSWVLKFGIWVTIQSIKLLLGPFTTSMKSQTKTFLPCATLIKTWTHLSKRRIHGSPKMTSTSHNDFKFFLTTSLHWLFTCILTMRGWNSKYTHLAKDSMEIQHVFTFQKKLFPLVWNRSSNV